MVGHSMGGAVVLAAAAHRPDLVRALVMLDPAILIAAELLPLAAQLAEAFDGPGGMEAVRQYESQRFFLESSDRDLKERVVDAACRTPQHVVASAFKNLLGFDAEAALVALSVPLLYVGAEPDLSGLKRLRELQPDAVIGKTAGSGHFHQLEVPEQINAMIERFLAISVPARRSLAASRSRRPSFGRQLQALCRRRLVVRAGQRLRTR